MSHRKGTTWDAPPHTIAKITMVRRYLTAWFSILGASFRATDLWYIDGFAGPGEYLNHPEGSPLAALRAAEDARAQTARWTAGTVRCAFIEDDAKRFAHLNELLQEEPLREGITFKPIEATFVDGLTELALHEPSPFGARTALFAFIDPFGPKGLAFDAVANLLSRPTCEVLINLDSDGIGRIYLAGDNANHRERLNEVFGDRDWEHELEGVRREELPQRVLEMYKRRLRAIPRVRYAFAFEMQSSADRLDYHLVFASQHPVGLQKMKEVMRGIDREGTYRFSDEHAGQRALFQFDRPETHAEQLENHFRGRKVAYREVDDFALNDSPFTNAKKMLKVLEDQDRISIACSKSNRKRGTYPEDAQATMVISFHGKK